MLKRFALFSLLLLMAAFITQIQTALAGDVWYKGGNDFTERECQVWYFQNHLDEKWNIEELGLVPGNPDEEDRGPSEDDGGVVLWFNDAIYWWMFPSDRGK